MSFFGFTPSTGQGIPGRIWPNHLNMETMFIEADATYDTPVALLCGKAAEWRKLPERLAASPGLFSIYPPWLGEHDNGS
jgi:hypothetical protein